MSAARPHRLTIPVAGFLLGLFAAACSSDSVTNAYAPFGLTLALSPSTDTIFVSDKITPGDTARLALSAKSISKPIQTPAGVEWTSGDTTVARVGSGGVIRAVGLGTTTVTARINDARATATIVVAHRAVRLTVSPSTLSGLMDGSAQPTTPAKTITPQ